MRITLGKVGLAAALALATGTAIATLTASAPSQARPQSVDHTVARQLSAAFQDIAATIQPSVVSIQAVHKGKISTNGLADLFGDRFGMPFDQREFFQQGQGSGFILDEEGHIVTNHHVVGDAADVTVVLADSQSYPAKVVGSDPKTDLAVIKISAEHLTPARLGTSKDLQVGEWVVAAGNPFGLSSTITTGIVSAKGRSGVGISDYEDFIQTDAAINPGNSGGPLVNLDGQVVGINSAIFSRNGGNVGIGFAIPMDLARRVIEDLVDEGRVVRGWLGVYIQDIDTDLAATFDYPSAHGALVNEVQPGSPAARAGLQSGDIIQSFAEEPVVDVKELRMRVADTRPDETIALQVFRDGKSGSLSVRIGELDRDNLRPVEDPEASTDLGMTLIDLTPRVSRQLGFDESVQGVAIREVQPFSAAGKAGLRAGDVILSVQGDPVSSTAAFRAAIREHGDRAAIRLEVTADGQAKRFAVLRIPR